MTLLMTILAAIVVLGPLVALHEWGHYIVARLCGVKVLTYSIGFGPKLISWTSRKTGINYALSALPLGGYVKMLDEREGEVAAHERHLAFNNQTPFKKIAVVAAGPLMNLLIAVLLFWVILLVPKTMLATKIGSIAPNTPASHAALAVGDEITAIDQTRVQNWQDINFALADRMGETGKIILTVSNAQGTHDVAVPITRFLQAENHHDKQTAESPIDGFGAIPWQPKITPVIQAIMPDSAAARQGLQVGDTITAVNGQPIDDWLSFANIVRQNPETLLHITVMRDMQPVTLQIMPQGKKDVMGNRVGQIGAQAKTGNIQIPAEYQQTVRYTPAQAAGKAVTQMADLSLMTLKSMGKMLTGQIGVENLSGPITIAKVAHQSFGINWQAVLSFMAVVSLSLAVLNLLPIPVLDGGHIVLYAYEAVFGKPMPERVQAIGMNIGLVLLGGFMILVIGNDISRLF
ncbi:RIP metalloprotease RseP [Moraxella atlantae]|uniref:Zinc metalloprotease n=1 Tax=Faucicola atlantae TaxID=34059 RepID=A0A1B8Q8I7_9GAMM|nr:RIP metalloprotease RseP [Moraxella atlantae]OBX72950.1 RIP metalloprotease RseP [Moraxella atlantae]